MRLLTLFPEHDSAKSFYNKAFYTIDAEGDETQVRLFSYDSHVMTVTYDGICDQPKVEMLVGSFYDSRTTRRHKREMLLQLNLNPSDYM